LDNMGVSKLSAKGFKKKKKEKKVNYSFKGPVLCPFSQDIK